MNSTKAFCSCKEGRQQRLSKFKTEGIIMHWDFPDTDVMDAESLEALVSRTVTRLDVYIDGFDLASLLRPWVEGFVTQFGDLLIAKAKLQLASAQVTTNEVTVSQKLDWDIHDQVFRHFMLEDLVQNYLVEHWSEGTVLAIGLGSREGRTLSCTFQVND